MKIKTRKQKLIAYNEKYSDRNYDPEKSLREYFKQRGWNLQKACKKGQKKFEAIEENRSYETIRIVMYEYPMKTDRPRVVLGHAFSPNAKENHTYFEQAIKQVCKAVNLITTPAEIVIDAYLEMPAQVSPDEVILFESKVLDVVDMPDYDNIGKCYTDILKNVLVTDDDIFHSGTVNKYYSVLPRVEIRITYQKYHDSDYVYKKIKHRKSIKELIDAGQLELQKISY